MSGFGRVEENVKHVAEGGGGGGRKGRMAWSFSQRLIRLVHRKYTSFLSVCVCVLSIPCAYTVSETAAVHDGHRTQEAIGGSERQ
jgi:hypothetical protein